MGESVHVSAVLSRVIQCQPPFLVWGGGGAGGFMAVSQRTTAATLLQWVLFQNV